MRGFVIRWAGLVLVLLLLATAQPGIVVEGLQAAFFALVALSLLNALVRPFLLLFRFATALINLLTLGLFALVTSFAVNVLIFGAVGRSGIVPGFKVKSWEDALVGALALSVANGVLSYLTKDKKR
ncbi:MAG TPA: phage holin family protein [Armatimonadetes bacterium]|nr:phage holin family protein [Armatimonadota bacterium]